MSTSFEDLEVWKRACRLSVDIYGILKTANDYVLKEQMCKAAVSIASNIAEGRDRGGRNEFIHFLRIAQGSSAELRTQLYIAKEIELIPDLIASDFLERAKIISRIIQGLIKSLLYKKTVNC